MPTPNLSMVIAAANRVASSSLLVMQEAKEWAQSTISHIAIERDAIQKRLDIDTQNYSETPSNEEGFTNAHRRLRELEQTEIICREIVDRATLGVVDSPTPGIPRNWTEQFPKPPADVEAFVDEDVEGAQRRYQNNPVALSEGVLTNLSDVEHVMQLPASLHKIINTLPTKALVVGGAVRDSVQGITPKDFDVEVYGTSYDDLHNHLARHGRVDTVGKSFGVLKYTDPDGNDYDFSIPRRDSKAGVGHKGFNIEFDPNISPREAASRRDFTMNSVAYDPKTNQVLDPFGGLEDIRNKVLRHTSDAFAEDPLRVLRGMQFAARFGMTLHPETARMVREHLSHDEHFSSLAKERVAEEWMKLATKGKEPGKAIQYLKDTDWIKHFPHIKGIVDVPQEHEWHPEGTVDLHTAHVMNEAARIADRDGLKGDDRATLVFAALTHDLAKAHTTQRTMKNGVERWTAHGHEEAGGPLAAEFLKSIGVKKSIIDRVVPMVVEHLAHIRHDGRPGFVRKLADSLHPANIEDLARLIEADHSGRPPLPRRMPEEASRMLELARSENVSKGRAEPYLRGRDVMQFYPNGGPHIGRYLAEAHKLQMEGKLNSRSEAMSWLENQAKGRVNILKGDDIMRITGLPGGPQIGQILDELWQKHRETPFETKESAEKWVKSRYT